MWRAITFCLIVNIHSRLQPPQDITQGILQGCCWLDGIALLWCQTKVGLQMVPCPLFHVWVHQQGTQKVPASHANGTPRCTISRGSYPIQHKGPASWNQQHFPIVTRGVETSPGHFRPMAHKLWLMCEINYLTVLRPIPMQAYGTTLVTWSLLFTQTHPTCTKQVAKAVRRDTSTSPIRKTKTSIREPFWHCQPSSSMWCLPSPKRNSQHCTTAARWLHPYASLSRNWSTTMPTQPQLPPTTSQRKASPWVPWQPKPQNSWINVFTGWNAVMPNINFNSNTYCERASSTEATTPASTMLPNITCACDLSMSSIATPHGPNEDLSKHYCQVCFPTCDGVLNIHISKLDTYLYPSRQPHLPSYYYLLHSIPLLIAITLVKSLLPWDPYLAPPPPRLLLLLLLAPGRHRHHPLPLSNPPSSTAKERGNSSTTTRVPTTATTWKFFQVQTTWTTLIHQQYLKSMMLVEGI